MDLAAIIAKLVGVVLLIWTLRSVYRHFFSKSTHISAGADKSASVSESFLNNLLLYLWLAFMLVFSVGMIVNN